MSPRVVTSPDFLSLAVRHLGAGALVAAVFGYATVRVYSDLEKRNDAFVDLIRQNIQESRAMADSINRLSGHLDENSDNLLTLKQSIEKLKP